MKNAIGLGLFAAALVSVASSKAANAGTYWSSNAASCTVAAGSGAYTVSAGTVHVTNGNTVTLYCPVRYAASLSGVTSLNLEVDHTGEKIDTILGHAYVRAELVGIARSTGAETTYGTFSPAGSSFYSQLSGSVSVPSPGFDFDGNFYYVRVVIIVNTNTTGYDQTLNGVGLKS
jgi:hypothetical protein